MKIFKLTLIVFVLRFTFVAHGAPECHSYLKVPSSRVTESNVITEKDLKRAWEKYSLMELSNVEQQANFEIIWSPYKAAIEIFLEENRKEQHLSADQILWFSVNLQIMLKNYIEKSRAELGRFWANTKPLMATDPHLYRERHALLNELILRLSDGKEVQKSFLMAIEQLLPKAKTIKDFKLN